MFAAIMYEIKTCEYITKEPWMIPLQQRIQYLLDAKNQQFKCVVYLYERPDTSTFRYRVYNMCQALKLSFEWRGAYFYGDELVAISDYVKYMDLVIVARFRWDFNLYNFIRKLNKSRIPTAFEVDDMVYNTDYVPMIINTLSINVKKYSNYDTWFASTSRLQATANMCDYMLTTTEYLADLIRADTGKRSFVIQNFYNYEQELVSENFYTQKKMGNARKPFTIGYFSGTPSHLNDFLVTAPEIEEFLNEHSDAKLLIVGFMELPEHLRYLEASGKIEKKRLVDFIELQRLIATVDVNIAPLINNKFSNCKSELKYYEASIVGTITCATPTEIYKSIIQNGHNGYLCEKGEWYNAIKKVYEQATETLGMADIARQFCKDRYSYSKQRVHMEDTFNKMIGR